MDLGLGRGACIYLIGPSCLKRKRSECLWQCACGTLRSRYDRSHRQVLSGRIRILVLVRVLALALVLSRVLILVFVCCLCLYCPFSCCLCLSYRSTVFFNRLLSEGPLFAQLQPQNGRAAEGSFALPSPHLDPDPKPYPPTFNPNPNQA